MTDASMAVTSASAATVLGRLRGEHEDSEIAEFLIGQNGCKGVITGPDGISINWNSDDPDDCRWIPLSETGLRRLRKAMEEQP